MFTVECADFTILVRDEKRSTIAGFPTKISESISCGTPVICTDTGDLKEYIHDGRNGFICKMENMVALFEQVLACSDSELDEIRDKCDAETFFYLHYQKEMKSFVSIAK